jgi:hypothetical protein
VRTADPGEHTETGAMTNIAPVSWADPPVDLRKGEVVPS